MSERRQVLEDFLQHPGWALFAAHVAEEWAPAGCWRKVKEVATRELDVAAAMQRVDYTNEQIGLLMRWPHEELERVTKQETAPALSMARGGYHR